jgi:flagellar biosynthetic protein FliO
MYAVRSCSVMLTLLCSAATAENIAPVTIVHTDTQPARSAAAERDAVSGGALPFQIVQAAGTSPAAPSTGLEQPIPLAPSRTERTSGVTGPAGSSTGRVLAKVGSSLAVVLGLFVLVVWFSRRFGSKRSGHLPTEVIDTLGRVPLNGRQEMHLVRVGKKLLLLSVTPDSAETLTEITDPVEIDRLTSICRQEQPDCISASFREVLSQLNGEPARA